MTMKKEKIVLYHPKFGTFIGHGDSIKEASRACLTKIAKTLKEKKIETDTIKMYLTQASKLIVKEITRQRG